MSSELTPIYPIYYDGLCYISRRTVKTQSENESIDEVGSCDVSTTGEHSTAQIQIMC